MRVNVHELIKDAGFDDTVYPGKRIIKKYPQSGDHKSHCAVADWSNPDRFRLELRAGLTGQQLPLSELRQYPISFQAQTYVDIAFNDNHASQTDEDEESESKGKGGGGKQPKRRSLEESGLSLSAFGKAMEGIVPSMGDIQKFVVMGKELARDAYETALNNLTHQLQQAKVLAIDILKGTSDIIKKATPGGGLEAKGDETIRYKYDAERTGPMFGASLTP